MSKVFSIQADEIDEKIVNSAENGMTEFFLHDAAISQDKAKLLHILKTAERCKLSTLTIQKLKTVLDAKGINKLTAQEIADRLGMTVRNANRILNNLEKGGSAHIAYTISSTSKGRPVKVYELNI